MRAKLGTASFAGQVRLRLQGTVDEPQSRDITLFLSLQLPPGRPVKDAIDLELENMRKNMDN